MASPKGRLANSNSLTPQRRARRNASTVCAHLNSPHNNTNNNMKTGHNLQSLYKAALLALVSASALAQDSLTNGLVGYYPFHGDANDYSGHGHDALASGAGVAARPRGRPPPRARPP